MYQIIDEHIYEYSEYFEKWDRIYGFNLITGAILKQDMDLLTIRENEFSKIEKDYLSLKIIPRNPKGYLYNEHDKFLLDIKSTSQESFNILVKYIPREKFKFNTMLL